MAGTGDVDESEFGGVLGWVEGVMGGERGCGVCVGNPFWVREDWIEGFGIQEGREVWAEFICGLAMYIYE